MRLQPLRLCTRTILVTIFRNSFSQPPSRFQGPSSSGWNCQIGRWARISPSGYSPHACSETTIALECMRTTKPEPHFFPSIGRSNTTDWKRTHSGKELEACVQLRGFSSKLPLSTWVHNKMQGWGWGIVWCWTSNIARHLITRRLARQILKIAL